MNIIGLDYGSSQVKMTYLKSKVLTGAKSLPRETFTLENTPSLINDFLDECEIGLEEVNLFALTGVGSNVIGEELMGVKTVKINEFAALAEGAIMLSGLERGLIASVGTGSAFVLANSKEDFRHIGGSGVGGGTLMGLAKAFLDVNTPEEFADLLEKGDLSKVDLTIGDINQGSSLSMLSAKVTSANFGKVTPDAKAEDFALGLYNMVCQTIGMLAVFALRDNDIKDVIVAGQTVSFPRAEELFELFHSMFDLRFHILTHCTYAVSMGAALLAENM